MGSRVSLLSKQRLFVVSSVVLGSILLSSAVLSPTGARRQNETPPTILDASEVFLTGVLTMATGVYKGEQRFYAFHNGGFVVYNEKRIPLVTLETSPNFYAIDPVTDSRGNVYFINSATDEISMLTSSGQWGGSFKVQERPYSLAILSDGNLVVGSPSEGKLLHVYDTSGRKLRSFGDVKVFDANNQAQNLFLNRGKVVVDSLDNVFLVFKYSPAPSVLKFSRKGRLLSEFSLEGYAIDLQVELARKYLGTKPSNEVGSIVVTNSAAIDPSTGHLWICMNGSSRSGIVYEYSPKGKKLREYSFMTALPSIHPTVLTYVTDIIVRSPLIYIQVDNGVWAVSSEKALARGDFVFAQTDCPVQQSWPTCPVNCTCGTGKDCKAALQAVVGASPYVTGSTCQQLGPGQGNPPKPNGGCSATVTTCDINTGVQTTTSATLDCDQIKYAC